MDTIQTLRVKPPQIAQTYLPERLARLDDNRQLLLGTQLASLGQRRFADPHLHNNCRRLLGAQFARLRQRRVACPPPPPHPPPRPWGPTPRPRPRRDRPPPHPP